MRIWTEGGVDTLAEVESVRGLLPPVLLTGVLNWGLKKVAGVVPEAGDWGPRDGGMLFLLSGGSDVVFAWETPVDWERTEENLFLDLALSFSLILLRRSISIAA